MRIIIPVPWTLSILLKTCQSCSFADLCMYVYGEFIVISMGIAVIIWGVLNTLGGFSVGLLMRCMASYVIVLMAIGLEQIGSFVFLIVWVRQPSFIVVVIISTMHIWTVLWSKHHMAHCR